MAPLTWWNASNNQNTLNFLPLRQPAVQPKTFTPSFGSGGTGINFASATSGGNQDITHTINLLSLLVGNMRVSSTSNSESMVDTNGGMLGTISSDANLSVNNSITNSSNIFNLIFGSGANQLLSNTISLSNSSGVFSGTRSSRAFNDSTTFNLSNTSDSVAVKANDGAVQSSTTFTINNSSRVSAGSLDSGTMLNTVSGTVSDSEGVVVASSNHGGGQVERQLTLGNSSNVETTLETRETVFSNTAVSQSNMTGDFVSDESGVVVSNTMLTRDGVTGDVAINRNTVGEDTTILLSNQTAGSVGITKQDVASSNTAVFANEHTGDIVITDTNLNLPGAGTQVEVTSIAQAGQLNTFIGGKESVSVNTNVADQVGATQIDLLDVGDATVNVDAKNAQSIAVNELGDGTGTLDANLTFVGNERTQEEIDTGALQGQGLGTAGSGDVTVVMDTQGGSSSITSSGDTSLNATTSTQGFADEDTDFAQVITSGTSDVDLNIDSTEVTNIVTVQGADTVDGQVLNTDGDNIITVQGASTTSSESTASSTAELPTDEADPSAQTGSVTTETVTEERIVGYSTGNPEDARNELAEGEGPGSRGVSNVEVDQETGTVAYTLNDTNLSDAERQQTLQTNGWNAQQTGSDGRGHLSIMDEDGTILMDTQTGSSRGQKTEVFNKTTGQDTQVSIEELLADPDAHIVKIKRNGEVVGYDIKADGTQVRVSQEELEALGSNLKHEHSLGVLTPEIETVEVEVPVEEPPTEEPPVDEHPVEDTPDTSSGTTANVHAIAEGGSNALVVDGVKQGTFTTEVVGDGEVNGAAVSNSGDITVNQAATGNDTSNGLAVQSTEQLTSLQAGKGANTANTVEGFVADANITQYAEGTEDGLAEGNLTLVSGEGNTGDVLLNQMAVDARVNSAGVVNAEGDTTITNLMDNSAKEAAVGSQSTLTVGNEGATTLTVEGLNVDEQLTTTIDTTGDVTVNAIMSSDDTGVQITDISGTTGNVNAGIVASDVAVSETTITDTEGDVDVSLVADGLDSGVPSGILVDGATNANVTLVDADSSPEDDTTLLGATVTNAETGTVKGSGTGTTSVAADVADVGTANVNLAVENGVAGAGVSHAGDANVETMAMGPDGQVNIEVESVGSATVGQAVNGGVGTITAGGAGEVTANTINMAGSTTTAVQHVGTGTAETLVMEGQHSTVMSNAETLDNTTMTSGSITSSSVSHASSVTDTTIADGVGTLHASDVGHAADATTNVMATNGALVTTNTHDVGEAIVTTANENGLVGNTVQNFGEATVTNVTTGSEDSQLPATTVTTVTEGGLVTVNDMVDGNAQSGILVTDSVEEATINSIATNGGTAVIESASDDTELNLTGDGTGTTSALIDTEDDAEGEVTELNVTADGTNVNLTMEGDGEIDGDIKLNNGADLKVDGTVDGDVAITTSSGSKLEINGGDNITLKTSDGQMVEMDINLNNGEANHVTAEDLAAAASLLEAIEAGRVKVDELDTFGMNIQSIMNQQLLA